MPMTEDQKMRRRAAKKAEAKPKSRGPARMQELGRRYVTLWLEADEYETVRAAAERAERPLAWFVRRAAVEKAESEE